MIIAEIGLNHKGSEDTAFRMLKKLVKTDIDAITFQIPNQEFFEKIKEWGGALSKDFYKNAIEYTHKNNKKIGFAIMDKSLIQFLNECGADFWKSLSISINDKKLLNEFQKTEKILLVSTGISNEKEIIEATKNLKNIRLIYTQLSADVKDSNLRAIEGLCKVTKRDVAFGLHCTDINVLYLSIAFNPSDVFFYVKENNKENYPDNAHAIVIDEVDNIVKNIKLLKSALGSSTKKTMKINLK